jgi:hypothetical protein
MDKWSREFQYGLDDSRDSHEERSLGHAFDFEDQDEEEKDGSAVSNSYVDYESRLESNLIRQRFL